MRIPLVALSALSLVCAACGDGGAASNDTLEDTSDPSDTLTPVDTIEPGTNRPPELERIGDRQVGKDRTLTITLVARDPDGDSLTYSLFGNLPEGARFDKTDHRFEWVPHEAGVTVFLTFVVSDGTDFDRETVRITVTDGVTANAPVFVPVSDQLVPVDQPFSLQLAATDPDGDILSFGVDGVLPTGAELDKTGAFGWTPTSDQVGAPIRVTFTVSDGTDSTGMPVRFVVDDGSSDLPRPPVFGALSSQSAKVDEALSFDLVATDPNGDAVTFALVGGAPERATLTGAKFAWTPSAAEVGQTFQVIFSASDGFFTVYASAKVSVVNAPTGPCTPDAEEPNEAIETATALPMGTRAASICETATAEDIDVYAVVIPAGHELKATLTFDAMQGDLDLLLVDANGDTLALSDGVTSTEAVRFRAASETTAWLVVLGYSSEPLSVGYTLETSSAESVACSDDTFEDNDAPATARSLDLAAQSTTLQICSSDADFWLLNVGCGQRVEVVLDILDGADLDLYLFDDRQASRDPVASAITEDATESIDFIAKRNPGTWVLEVSGYPFASAESAYELVSDVTGGCQDDALANPSKASAKGVTGASGKLEDLTVCCGEDWFAWTLAAGDQVLVDVTVSGQGSAGVAIFASNGTTQLAAKDASPSGAIAQFTATTAGTYYARVTGEALTKYAFEWDVTGGGGGCTLMSCAKYDVCDAGTGTCVSDLCFGDDECPAAYKCRETYCVDTCQNDQSCRAGYACKGFDDGNYCGVSGTGTTGAACFDHTGCASNYACLYQNRGGYCAERGCTGCDPGTKCATVGGKSFCAKTCNTGSDCRASEGYICSAEKTCLPQNP